jgi:hypothetical protein
MKIYHLDIRSESDSRFDMHFFYTHDNDAKSYQDLQTDYCNAYDLDDILEKIEAMGWKPISANVQTASVRF